VLLEALIAVIIVGLIGSATLAMLGGQFRTAGRAADLNIATDLARERLETLRLLSADRLVPLADSLRRGRFEAPLDAYSWTATTKATRDEIDLYDLSVVVSSQTARVALDTRVHRARSVVEQR
jgi:type II secretory pathway pseudopilin PulG